MFKRAMLEKMQLVGEITELAIATADEVLEQLIQFDQRLILYVSIVFTVTMVTVISCGVINLLSEDPPAKYKCFVCNCFIQVLLLLLLLLIAISIGCVFSIKWTKIETAHSREGSSPPWGTSSTPSALSAPTVGR